MRREDMDTKQNIWHYEGKQWTTTAGVKSNGLARPWQPLPAATSFNIPGHQWEIPSLSGPLPCPHPSHLPPPSHTHNDILHAQRIPLPPPTSSRIRPCRPPPPPALPVPVYLLALEVEACQAPQVLAAHSLVHGRTTPDALTVVVSNLNAQRQQ